MSVTTTQTLATGTLLHLLADYDLHHSGDDAFTAPAPNTSNANPGRAASSPTSPSVSTSISSSNSTIATSAPSSTSHAAEVPQEAQDDQPAHWPRAYRSVPPYRPINRNLDYEERPAGLNAGEYVFVQVMLNGVRLNSNASRLWRATGGKLNDRIFRYQIGGEW